METIGSAVPTIRRLDELDRRFALDDRQVRLVIFLFPSNRYEAFRDFSRSSRSSSA